MGFAIFVGVDWGAARHQVAVVGPDGQVRYEGSIAHDGQDISELGDKLVELGEGKPEQVAVAIETPRGAVVATLMERGMAVFAVNPKQLDRFRDRHTVAGAKDDRRDAYVLADSLRTDLHLFRQVRLGDPRLVELRELVKMHEELQAERVQLGNRLHEQLIRFYPQILELGSVHTDRWLRALVERAPTPVEGARLSLAKIETILSGHGIRKITAAEVRAVLKRSALHVAPGVADACKRHITMLLPKLRLADEQLRETSKELESLLEQMVDEPSADDPVPACVSARDVEILRSLPGVGTFVSATILAEAWQALAARDYQFLRAYAGIAPITKQSGKSRQVVRRTQCSDRLSVAVYHWTVNALRVDPRARAHYTALRQRGHSHGRAVRGVADRLLALLIAMLKSRQTYEPSRRKAAA